LFPGKGDDFWGRTFLSLAFIPSRKSRPEMISGKIFLILDYPKTGVSPDSLCHICHPSAIPFMTAEACLPGRVDA
jgi:hypothetical protein